MSEGGLGRTALVLHTPVISGPAASFATRLPLVAEPGSRVVYAPAAGPAADLFEPLAEVRVIDYDALAVPASPLRLPVVAARFVRQVARFRREFRVQRVDTVICATTYTPAAQIAARSLRLRTVVYCGEILRQSGERRALKRCFAGALIRLVSRAELVVCCSRLVERQFPARARTATVYPSIPVARLKALRSESPLAERDCAVVVVGSISESRGQDYAVWALAEIRAAVPAARLLIAGEPATGAADVAFRDSLAMLAEDLDVADAVEFLGHVGDVGSLYARARVVLNPARFDEPFGRVAYEALAAGCGVVLSDTGAARELLSDGETARIVPSGDKTAIAAAVIALLTDPQAASEMAQRADAVLEIVDAARTDAEFARAIASLDDSR